MYDMNVLNRLLTGAGCFQTLLKQHSSIKISTKHTNSFLDFNFFTVKLVNLFIYNLRL